MFNKITLIGNWVADPELRYSQNGTEIMNATIAVRDSFDREHTDFVDVTAFKKTALNTVEYTKKGHRVLVEGKLQQQRWEKDGQKRSKHVVIANQVVFLESKGKQNQQPDNGGRNAPTTNTQQPQQQSDPFANDGKPIEIDDSSLPF